MDFLFIVKDAETPLVNVVLLEHMSAVLGVKNHEKIQTVDCISGQNCFFYCCAVDI